MARVLKGGRGENSATSHKDIFYFFKANCPVYLIYIPQFYLGYIVVGLLVQYYMTTAGLAHNKYQNRL